MASDAFFVITCVVAASFVAIILILLIWHYFARVQELKGENKDTIDVPAEKFSPQVWSNVDCDLMFKKACKLSRMNKNTVLR